MRYGIFADIHSNLEALEKVLEEYQKENIDTYFCVGDIIGYAADPSACIKKIKNLNCVTVAGNHEWACINKLSLDYFNEVAQVAIIWTKDKLSPEDKNYLESLKLIYKNEDFTPLEKTVTGVSDRDINTDSNSNSLSIYSVRDKALTGFTLVHGTLEQPEEFNYIFDNYDASKTFALQETNICFVGHTHRPVIFIQEQNDISYCPKPTLKIEKSKKYIVNVGSIGQPRDGNPQASFCIYDTDTYELQIKRISYAVKKTYDKIIKAGLPRYLAERLLVGR